MMVVVCCSLNVVYGVLLCAVCWCVLRVVVCRVFRGVYF